MDPSVKSKNDLMMSEEDEQVEGTGPHTEDNQAYQILWKLKSDGINTDLSQKAKR